MVASGANLRRFRTNHDVATVAALPDAITVAAKHDAFLDIFEELAVALFVVLLNGCYEFEFSSNLREAFFACFLPRGFRW